jgi:hypothetical protein
VNLEVDDLLAGCRFGQSLRLSVLTGDCWATARFEVLHRSI